MTEPGRPDLARDTAESVARRSYGRLLAILATSAGDLMSAEDALSDAFASALERWPVGGCPVNPEAWLLTVARRKAIDAQRRTAAADAASAVSLTSSVHAGEQPDAAAIPDRRLAMMFACTDDAVDPAARAPLILQVVLGLDARAIAAAFLASPAAMAKRLVRAKTRIRETRVPLTVPDSETLSRRLGPVLDAIYAAFTEGWRDPGEVEPARRDLADEALFLAELVVDLVPSSAEAAGLLALILYAESRRGARTSEGGEFIPLDRQPHERWHWAMIRRANALLKQASGLGDPGRYQLEAALQSAHLLRQVSGIANWTEVVALYDGLFALTGSPVVLVNRALALAELSGPEAAWSALGEIADDERLRVYQPYWVARGHLARRIGQEKEGEKAFEIAIGLSNDPSIRRHLQHQRIGKVPP
jgi:RNA polymerase sigma-70 factor (ECF subfamily)